MWQRISLIFRSKANKALDRAEDPRETLDYSYQRQLDLLAKVRRGVADVATSRKRVELQVNQLTAQSDKLQGQAEQAIKVGREDLAREADCECRGLDERPGRVGDAECEHELVELGEEQRGERRGDEVSAAAEQ